MNNLQTSDFIRFCRGEYNNAVMRGLTRPFASWVLDNMDDLKREWKLAQILLNEPRSSLDTFI